MIFFVFQPQMDADRAKERGNRKEKIRLMASFMWQFTLSSFRPACLASHRGTGYGLRGTAMAGRALGRRPSGSHDPESASLCNKLDSRNPL